MNETHSTNCEHSWSESTAPDYWWCYKCGGYLKKGEPEERIIYSRDTKEFIPKESKGK